MPSREKRVRETRAGTTTHGRAVTLSTVRTSKFQLQISLLVQQKNGTLYQRVRSQNNLISNPLKLMSTNISYPIP